MRKVGIIGAGLMGTGIAQTVAQAGMDVVLADIDLAIAEKARDSIDRTLTKLVEKGKMDGTAADAIVARIQPAADYQPMRDADLIIEAATEREDVKRMIFGSIARDRAIATRCCCPPDSWFG